MKKLFLPSLLLLSFLSAAPTANAQACAPEVVENTKTYNIFSPEQETIFGNLSYEQMAGEMRFIRDPVLVTYLENIGQRLTKHLPQTGLKYRYFIIDLPEANAFNTPGGYIFVSRKLIGFANTEDELAGVIAHELGHAAVRHAASDMSDLLKRILNVTRLGDAKDVADKYNLLLDRQNTKNLPQRSGHESDQQLQADRIGLFAMVAAGYDPTAFGSFFARLVEDKTSNRFSELFGKVKPENKRLREMVKLIQLLPNECRDARAANTTEVFLSWQAKVVSYREMNKREELAGLLWKKELTPKLRSDISHFAFSPNGKLFLAQDDFAITVIQREPLQILFQIPATDSRNAEFTSDGDSVVFGSENLRYEKWSIAQKKPVEIRELVVRRDCWEHEFSPDGKYLACIDLQLRLNVLETQSGKKIWEKKDFYQLDFLEFFAWLEGEIIDKTGDVPKRLFNFVFAPDSKLLTVTRSHNYRSKVTVDYVAVAGTEDTMLALDLTTLKPVSVGGDLKKVTRRNFLFLNSSRILAMVPEKIEDGGVFSFPDGKRLARFPIGGRVLQRTGNKNYVIVKPLTNAKLGIFDMSRNTLVGSLDQPDAAIWENILVHETINGSVMLSEVSYNESSKELDSKPLGTIEVPVAAIGPPEAADISDNLEWLALSSKTRGAMWNLNTGERKMYVRGFRGALVTDSGNWIGDFPKYETVNHSLLVLKPRTNEASNLRHVAEHGVKQYRRFVLARHPLKPQKEKSDADRGEPSASEAFLTRDVRFELLDLITSKTVWTAEYQKEAPKFFFDPFAGRLILYWTLNNDRAKATLKENPDLAARAKQMGNKDDDYLVQVVDAYAGKTIGTLLIETGKGSFSIENGFSESDWLVLRDSENRVLAYSLKEGVLKHRFFGWNAAISPTDNQVVIENYPGEISFYDLSTGESQSQIIVPVKAAFIRFTADGKKLFVLSGEQTAYAFDIQKLRRRSVVAQ